MSNREKIDSDFDYESFELPSDTGEGNAILVNKAWGKKANLICYFIVDGRKIKLSTWSTDNYMPKDNSFDFSYEDLEEEYFIQWESKNGKLSKFIAELRGLGKKKIRP